MFSESEETGLVEEHRDGRVATLASATLFANRHFRDLPLFRVRRQLGTARRRRPLPTFHLCLRSTYAFKGINYALFVASLCC